MMFIKKYIRITLIVLFSESLQFVFGQTADSLFVIKKVDYTYATSYSFLNEIWQNPAMHYYALPFSWTSIKAKGIYHDKANAYIRQTGKKETSLGVDVNSFVILSKKERVFGTAGYKNEEQKNVSWNENQDWDIVAPYVTGDSIGGFLKGETYYFSGGYAHEFLRTTWGIEGKYRASHNFRDKDPRPRNITSDLTVSTGLTYQASINYRIGMNAGLRIYHQTGNIQFLADQGNSPVYQMLGMTLDYVRFAGDQRSVEYEGISWNGGLNLIPTVTEKGLSASLWGEFFNLNKKLPNANNITLTNSKTLRLKGNVAWIQKRTQDDCIGAKLNLSFFNRKGSENNYGEGSGNMYKDLISTTNGLQLSGYNIMVEGLWERNLSKRHPVAGHVIPIVTYSHFEERYKILSNSFMTSAIEGNIKGLIQYRPKTARFLTEVQGGYHANIRDKQSLNNINLRSSRGEALISNINYLTDSFALGSVRLGYDYPLRNHYDLCFSFKWEKAFYCHCGTQDYIECTLGFEF